MTAAAAAKKMVGSMTAFVGTDLADLCDAAEAAVADGGGFGWLKAPPRYVMETYWKGVLLVPERSLFIARLDGTICGSAQLVRPPRNNEAQALAAQLTSSFIAPWARGRGLGRLLVERVERAASEAGFEVLNLDVRATQTVAIDLFQSLGYEHWGTHPHYARVDGEVVQGHFYMKRLAAAGKAVS